MNLHVLAKNNAVNQIDAFGLYELGEACCDRAANLSNFTLSDNGSAVAFLSWKFDYKLTGPYENVRLESWTCTWQANSQNDYVQRHGFPPYGAFPPYWTSATAGYFPKDTAVIVAGRIVYETCLTGVWTNVKRLASNVLRYHLNTHMTKGVGENDPTFANSGDPSPGFDQDYNW